MRVFIIDQVVHYFHIIVVSVCTVLFAEIILDHDSQLLAAAAEHS